MKRIFFILSAIYVSTCLLTDPLSAQSYHRISENTLKLEQGKTRVVQGYVRDGEEVLYRFKARAGQSVTVKIVGQDADFSVYLNHGLDAERVAQETKSWSGKMPPEFDGDCEIAVHSNYKVAAYSLDILLK
ncbi:hypothetical protein FBR05_01715 [Deltaproteobacteria bacterium PRO3]|nr:hypothetical protein [Deltaproteobacteria bacterium PRO3]